MKGYWRLVFIVIAVFMAGCAASWVNGYLGMYLSMVTMVVLGAVGGVMLYLKATGKPTRQVTEKLTRRNFQEDLRASEERLKLVIEGTNDGIWDWDIPSGKVYWSERVNLLADNTGLGLGDDWELLKSKLVVDSFGNDREKLDAAIRSHVSGSLPFSVEVRMRLRDGGVRHLLIRGKAKRNEQGIPVRMAGSISDVSQSKEAEQKLIHNAYHDALTNEGNRRLFTDRLEHQIEKAQRRPDYLFALLIIDIDKFRFINDMHGHTIGDGILREFSARLRDCCRAFEAHTLARIGGDVFGILAGDLRSPQQALDLARSIQVEMQPAFKLEGLDIALSSTIGIVTNGDHLESMEELLSNADTVLQEAKRRPLDTRSKFRSRAVVFDSPMRRKAQDLYRLEQELRKAIDLEQFFLVYQPIMNIRTNTVVGFEALVRWSKDATTEVQPADFIPMAENTGLILPMGQWILSSACRQAKAWVEAGYADITVAVNFSAKQFLQQELAAQVRSVLSETGLDPRNLKVEITESTAAHELERTIETMNHLTQMGLQISIDDFGTDYSSLKYLQRYPLDTLKIDRSFVKDIPKDEKDMAITRTIISLAKNLQLKIIAEGVETKEQLEFLRAEGCEQIQGYYFSRPLHAEAATKYLEMHAA